MRDRNNNFFAVLCQTYGTKDVIGASRIDPRSFCEHLLQDMSEQQADDLFTKFPAVTEAVVAMIRDRELQTIELPCTDAAHWLTILAESEVEIQSLEAEYERKKSAAKVAKEAVDQAISRQRDNIRKATKPQDEVPPIIALAEAQPEAPVVEPEGVVDADAGVTGFELDEAASGVEADEDAPAVDPEQGF